MQARRQPAQYFGFQRPIAQDTWAFADSDISNRPSQKCATADRNLDQPLF